MRDKLRNGETCGSTRRREGVKTLQRRAVSKLSLHLVDWRRGRPTLLALEGIGMKKGTIRREAGCYSIIRARQRDAVHATDLTAMRSVCCTGRTSLTFSVASA